MSNTWIPCSERLPEHNKIVLLWIESTTISGTQAYSIGACANAEFWFVQNGVASVGFPNLQWEVKAWQHLPEPYKEVHNE